VGATHTWKLGAHGHSIERVPPGLPRASRCVSRPPLPARTHSCAGAGARAPAQVAGAHEPLTVVDSLARAGDEAEARAVEAAEQQRRPWRRRRAAEPFVNAVNRLVRGMLEMRMRTVLSKYSISRAVAVSCDLQYDVW